MWLDGVGDMLTGVLGWAGLGWGEPGAPCATWHELQVSFMVRCGSVCKDNLGSVYTKHTFLGWRPTDGPSCPLHSQYSQLPLQLGVGCQLKPVS